MSKFALKVLRLTTDEDLIGFVFESNGLVNIKHPKYFFMNEGELEFLPWLNPDFFAIDEVILSRDKVLFQSYPTSYLGYNYLQILHDELDEESELYQEIKSTIEQVDKDLDNPTIH